ncbi:hypothetical protein B9Z19DRAFT_1125147 [Tuber borchii]|uniref:Uncharacterized protein n=1 Tax=Tuber borchii TaxID=42251 RepID=A0A2T6ZVH8_TUBBO|nr:hypothetical protein B9Z19DRAFT_1125147 [Tuber borchii]
MREPSGIRGVTNSQCNTVIGVEGEPVDVANYLMLQCTLFVDPLRTWVTLTSPVHSSSTRPLDEIAAARNIEASEKGVDLLKLDSEAVRGKIFLIFWRWVIFVQDVEGSEISQDLSLRQENMSEEFPRTTQVLILWN